MKNSKMIGGLAAVLLAAGCVAVDAPAAPSKVQVSSFIPDSGMPAGAVISVRRLPDSNPSVADRVIVKFYPSMVSQAQIDAAPEAVCKSMGLRQFFGEFLPIDTTQAGPAIAKMLVHCR